MYFRQKNALWDLDFFRLIVDNCIMDIQGLSVALSQNRVQEEAAVQVQAMAISTAREQGEDLARIMESAELISDPVKGNYLDLSM